MRDAGVEELLALGHEPELLVVAHQAGLGLHDEVAVEALGVFDAGAHDLWAEAGPAEIGVDHKPAEARAVLGGDCLLYTSPSPRD